MPSKYRVTTEQGTYEITVDDNQQSGSGQANTPVPPGIAARAKDSLSAMAQPEIGIAKGAASTLAHTGQMMGRAEKFVAGKLGLPVDKLPDKLKSFLWLDDNLKDPRLQAATTPKGLGQKAGFYGEQAAEFLLPIGEEAKGAEALAKGSKLAAGAKKGLSEFLKGTAIGTAQTGSVKQGVETGAISAAAVPVAAGLKALGGEAGPLQKASKDIYRRTLLGGGGNEEVRLTTDKVVPEAIARKLWGSTWDSMSKKVTERVQTAGKAVKEQEDKLIKEAEETYFPSGTGVRAKTPTPKEAEDVLYTPLNDLRQEARRMSPDRGLPGQTQRRIEGTSFQQGTGSSNPPGATHEAVIDTTQGKLSTQPVIDALYKYRNSFMTSDKVVYNESAYQKTTDIISIINEHKGDISLADMIKARRLLDDQVADTGYIVESSTQSLKASQRAAADSYRHYLSQEFPSLAKINKEFSFWRSVQDVMSDTTRRKAHGGHAQGIVEAGAGAVAAGTGALVGGTTGSIESFLGTAGAVVLNRLIQSTGFKTVTSIGLDRLATLLAERDPAPALRYIGELTDAVATGRTPAPPGADKTTAPPKP